MVFIENAKKYPKLLGARIINFCLIFQNSGVASQLQIFFSDFANGILLIKGLQKNKPRTGIQIHAG
jgi:hypothetical protein